MSATVPFILAANDLYFTKPWELWPHDCLYVETHSVGASSNDFLL